MNKIYNMDCLEGLKQIDSNSVDFILADPPFNIGLKDKMANDNMPPIQFEKWCSEWLIELNRVLKTQHFMIMFFADATMFQFVHAIEKSGLNYLHILKWHKPNTITNLRGTRLYGSTQLMFVLSNGKPDSKLVNVKKLGRDTLFFNAARRTDVDDVKHCARYPTALYQKIIEGFTNKGDLVLDPFMGSGTTAVAAKKLGRNFIGFEIELKYCKLIEGRLERLNTYTVEEMFGEVR